MIIHAIDVGSTHIKYTGYEASGAALHSTALSFPPPCREEAPFFEVRIEEIMRAIRQLLRNCVAGDAILLSAQMHGYILMDADDTPLTEYISWRDRRAALLPENERFNFSLPPEAGVNKKDNLPLASLLYMKQKEQSIYRRARTVCTLGSYIAHALCGVNASHISDCAPSGLYNCLNGARRSVLSELAAPMAYLTMECIGNYGGAAVYTPVGDQQASVAGSGIAADEYLLNIGTAAQACTVSEAFVTGDFESRPYFDGCVLCTVTGLIGGSAYQTLQQNDEASVVALAENYGSALQRLPKRNRLRAIGGAFAYHRNLLKRVLDRIGIEWTIDEEGNATEGLYRLFCRRLEREL